MSDKLNLLTSNIIRFVAGERPTADKFNAMNVYYTRAIDNICRAIGDMHDRSAHQPLSPQWNPNQASLEYRPLDIVNLARLIGPASNLNPKMFAEVSEIEEIITRSDFLNSKEFVLKYEIQYTGLVFPTIQIEKFNSSGLSLGVVNLIGGDCYILFKRVLAFKSNIELNPGEYFKVTYTTEGSTQGGINYLGASFNTIPDPNEEVGLTSDEIIENSEDNGYNYKINLLERKIKDQQSGTHRLYHSDVSGKDEFNNNASYSLPKWWENKFSLNGGDPVRIPDGLIYLKNINTGEIYLTAEYAASDIHTIYIAGANLCLTDEHRLICAGTDITTSIDDLRNKMFNHSHDGSFGESFIRIQDLVGKYVTGEFGPSTIPGNEFPMYLHRKGYLTDGNVQNGNNAMLGDLFMGNPLFSSTGEIQGRLLNSHKIIFGSEESYISKALGTLVIRSVYEGDDESRGNILIRSSNEVQVNSRVNKMLGDASNILEAENNYVDSTSNTRINSDNETYLQINNKNVVVLKNNDENTRITGLQVTSINGLGGGRPTEWDFSSRPVLIRSESMEKKNYNVIDFQPSINGRMVAPCGVVTQYDAPTSQRDINYLFVTNSASLYKNGELWSSVGLHYHDTKGRTFHDLNIPYESFILNYKKKITVPFGQLNPSDFGVWDQQYEKDNPDDPSNADLSLGEEVAGKSGVDICFGGINYSDADHTKGSDGVYMGGSAYGPTYSHRFETHDTTNYVFNRNSFSRIVIDTSHEWADDSTTVGNIDYDHVDLGLITNFRLLASDELVDRETGVITDFMDSLLEEINYNWGIRVKYIDGNTERISWLVGAPYGSQENVALGVTHDYIWQWSETGSEFDLKLNVNPARLFKESAAGVLADKENYTFETIWRPYNYTRPSLKPTDLNVVCQRITDSDINDGDLDFGGINNEWRNTAFNYAFLAADYEEDVQPTWINEGGQDYEAIDQRVPVGAGIGFLNEDRDQKDPLYKKLCPVSFGVLNGDYHPDDGLSSLLASNEIHTADEIKSYCRAASVGGSKQSIAIARNVLFEEGVSSKNFIINTDGGKGSPSDSTFLFEEYQMAIKHRNSTEDRNEYTFRRGINCVEKPNFLLHYDVENLEGTTFSINFNGSDALYDAEIENSFLENKVINLSTIINKRFSTDIWRKNFLDKYNLDRAEDDQASIKDNIVESRYGRYYFRDSEIKARLNCQKNWLTIQKQRGKEITRYINGVKRVEGNNSGKAAYRMLYFLQAMFVSVYDQDEGDQYGPYIRMPHRFYGVSDSEDGKFSPYFREIFFDVNMEVKETYNSYSNHLSIDVKCNYIIKNHILRKYPGQNWPQFLWSKKGVLDFPIYSPRHAGDSDYPSSI